MRSQAKGLATQNDLERKAPLLPCLVPEGLDGRAGRPHHAAVVIDPIVIIDKVWAADA